MTAALHPALRVIEHDPLLSDAMIATVRETGQFPKPDTAFVVMVRNQYNRFKKHLRHRDFDDFLQDALVFYWKACNDYKPERGYSRGPVGFVGGRVIARLRNSCRTDVRRSQNWIGDIPTDPDGNPYDLADDSAGADLVEASAMYEQVRSRTVSSLGLSIGAVEAIFDLAAEGDSGCVDTIRAALAEHSEEPMSSPYEFVYPRDDSRRKLSAMTPETVARGLVRLGIEVDFLRDMGADRPVLDAVTANLDGAIDALDRHVDATIKRDRDPFNCVIESDDHGCGSIIPDVGVCMYCGEILEDDYTEDVIEITSTDDPDETTLPVAEVADAEPETPAPAAQEPAQAAPKKAKGRGKGKSAGSSTAASKPKRKRAPAKKKKTPEPPTSNPIARARRKGGRPKNGECPEGALRAFADKRPDVTIRERSLFLSVWVDETKICTSKRTTSCSGFPISWEVFAELPDDVKNAAVFNDKAERRRRHYGRDSVIFKGDDPAIVDVLLSAAYECCGQPILDSAQVDEALAAS